MKMYEHTMNTIDLNHLEQCTLSIRLGTDGIALAVSGFRQESGETAMEIEHCPLDESLPLTVNLRKICEERPWMHRPFWQVNVLMVTKRFTSVPLELFAENMAEVMFYRNHLMQENELVLCNPLRVDNVAVLFGFDKSVRDFLDGLYPGARYFAQASVLIHCFSALGRSGNVRKLFAYVRGEYMDVFCYDCGRLLLANAYKCSVTADRIYYLLYVWKTLGFDQESDELHLCGNGEEREELLSGLREFVRQVSVMNPAEDIDLRSVLSLND